MGHYGVFNGSRFRSEIVPRIADFVLTNNASRTRSARARTVTALVGSTAAASHASAPAAPTAALKIVSD